MRIIILFVGLLFTSAISAQELNCQVSIQSNPSLALNTTDKEILKELEQAITEMMNETSWTKDKFEVEERINCNLMISITKIQGTENFQANVQVQASRPVYNTTYNTTLFNYLDEEVAFNFKRGAKIIYSDNQYTNNLASILAFYANYILGLDGDSFSLKGGDPYLRKAQDIAMLAQQSGGDGWKAGQTGKGKRNRYWLIDNTLQELFLPLRECFYEYHRQGLDKMYDNQKAARDEMQKAIEKLNKVNSARPGSVNVENFVRSKRDELTSIFTEADKKQQTELVNVLKRLDPTNASKYQEIFQ